MGSTAQPLAGVCSSMYVNGRGCETPPGVPVPQGRHNHLTGRCCQSHWQQSGAPIHYGPEERHCITKPPALTSVPLYMENMMSRAHYSTRPPPSGSAQLRLKRHCLSEMFILQTGIPAHKATPCGSPGDFSFTQSAHQGARSVTGPWSTLWSRLWTRPGQHPAG